jgi:hypothetical protein
MDDNKNKLIDLNTGIIDLSRKPANKAMSKIYVMRQKYSSILSASVKSAAEFIDLNIPQKTQIRIITTKSFNALSAIDLIARSSQIDEIYISVYAMNQASTDWLLSFFRDNAKTAGKIVLASFFQQTKRYQGWCENLIASKSDNLVVKFDRIHAKVFIAKTRDGRHFILEGSGNLSGNARIEQYIFENNEEVYNFHKKWMDDIT